ncbi:MAG: hypothetical protein HQ477_04875 [Chloroflexi bacterium]|nr:hypothetical protein [Chloroflexota bacterium]
MKTLSPARLTRSLALIQILLTLSLVFAACGNNDSAPSQDSSGSSNSSSSNSSGSSEPPSDSNDGHAGTTPTPALTPTPDAPRFAGYDISLSKDDFWRFKWEWVDQNCAQRSGCKTTKDEGVFQVTLTDPWEINGITLFRLVTTGSDSYTDDATTRTFSPRWQYMGIDGDRIVVVKEKSANSPFVTLFDARTGKWAGSGFFTERLSDDELVEARAGQLSTSHQFASWEGVEVGPWHSVGTASSQGKCETIEGRKICPREESFDYTESEYYRPGIGPFGYEFRYSSVFSGGGFTTSFQTEERVALIASSFDGDAPSDLIPGAIATLTPVASSPTLEPSPTPVVLGDPIYGPVDGNLTLFSLDEQIPEFASGVNIDAGVIDVTFDNPLVRGTWSHGIFFRNATEETFHAVFIKSDGGWGHFARGGSLDSQIVLALGQFDFDTTTGGTNKLTVWFGVLGEKTTGYFQINDQDVAVLDLSFPAALGPGDVNVVSGLFPTDDLSGGSTHFTDFAIYEKP